MLSANNTVKRSDFESDLEAKISTNFSFTVVDLAEVIGSECYHKKHLFHIVNRILQNASSKKDSNAIVDLFVLAFLIRDCRQGTGMRLPFYYIILETYKAFPETVLHCISEFGNYGYGKDFLILFDLCGDELSISESQKEVFQGQVIFVVFNNLYELCAEMGQYK
jgi:hypothetical protein